MASPRGDDSKDMGIKIKGDIHISFNIWTNLFKSNYQRLMPNVFLGVGAGEITWEIGIGIGGGKTGSGTFKIVQAWTNFSWFTVSAWMKQTIFALSASQLAWLHFHCLSSIWIFPLIFLLFSSFLVFLYKWAKKDSPGPGESFLAVFYFLPSLFFLFNQAKNKCTCSTFQAWKEYPIFSLIRGDVFWCLLEVWSSLGWRSKR